MEILIQGIGTVGIIMGMLAYQSNEHRKILHYRIANELSFAVQYALLGAYAGTLVNLLVCIRNFAFRRAVERNQSTTPLIIVFCLLFVFTTVLTWPGLSGFLIIATKAISTLAFGNKNPRILRILDLLSCILWLFYNISVHSYTGMLCEFLSISSILIAMIRFGLFVDRQKKVMG